MGKNKFFLVKDFEIWEKNQQHKFSEREKKKIRKQKSGSSGSTLSSAANQ